MIRLLPIDVVIALFVSVRASFAFEDGYAILAHQIGISPSQAFSAVDRANQARLIVRTKSQRRMVLEPIRDNLFEFLVHGVRYAYPASLGQVTRGVPTAHSAPGLHAVLKTDAESVVWPSATGSARGQALEPLHRSVPHLALDDQTVRTYNAFAAIDLIRIGGARERKIGSQVLEGLLKHWDPH